MVHRAHHYHHFSVTMSTNHFGSDFLQKKIRGRGSPKDGSIYVYDIYVCVCCEDMDFEINHPQYRYSKQTDKHLDKIINIHNDDDDGDMFVNERMNDPFLE